MRRATGLLVGALAFAAGACGAAPRGTSTVETISNSAPRPPDPVASLPTPAPPPDACARRRPGEGALPVNPVRQSSTVVLARLGSSTIAYVADADDDAVHTVDVDTLAELAVTPLPGSPAELLVLADGRVAVTLRDRNRVAVYEPGPRADHPLEERCSAPVAAEPIAIAATPDDRRLAVTSGWGHALTILDASDLAPARAVDLAREPRAVVIDDDGKRAFVSHVIGGALSVVDLDGAAPARSIDLRRGTRTGSLGRDRRDDLRAGVQGYALARAAVGTAGGPSRIFAPLVSVDPGEPKQTKGYGSASDWGPPVASPFVSVVDPRGEKSIGQTSAIDRTRLAGECLLPRAAAAHGDSLYVTCLGVDAVLELDARAYDPIRAERRRFRVPAGPTGLAVDEARGRVIVHAQFAHEIAVIDLASRSAPVTRAPLARRRGSPITAAIARGRELFHATGDVRISRDGRACASCHPEGRMDALTWSTPDGPRQTPMLAGRVEGSAPYGWFGRNRTLHDHIGHTLRRLGGDGLSAAKDRPDLDALVAYLAAIRPPSREGAPVDPARQALAARGRALFLDARAGCATCHMGGGTDRTAYDVKSGDVDEASLKFDTPSLRFVGGTAPYFHDGRYATLEDLLAKSDGAMGHTRHLAKDDLRALAAYLETL